MYVRVVHNVPNGGGCTGTVIDRGGTLNGVSRNGLVLTAAHCFCIPAGQVGSSLSGIGPNTNVNILRYCAARHLTGEIRS